MKEKEYSFIFNDLLEQIPIDIIIYMIYKLIIQYIVY